MALIQTSLIWVAYAVAIALLVAVAGIFVYVYQKPRERAVSVTTVCISTVSVLLATTLLLPVDVALVSSTVSSKTGVRKDWATQDRVDNIVYVLKIVYYTLYSLDALLCLLVVPFTYFLYEEYDEVQASEGSQSFQSRLIGALKYTLIFLVLCVILFLVGFFIPAATYEKQKGRDLDYFKHLLTENSGEKALTFGLGLLMTLGTLVYILYTGSGLALLPVTLIRSAPAISAPSLAATTQSELEQNRERQQQLEARNEGRPNGPDAGDRRELEALLRDERTLVRRERLAAESQGEGRHFLVQAWTKSEAFFRPVKLLGGLLLLFVAVTIWVSMLITSIDKAKNSVCKQHCGYLLGNINVFQPINYILVMAAKLFPIDYVLYALLVFFFYSASVIGIATVGIRFLWIVLFKIRKGKTSPQAMLMATILLALMVLAINYSLAMIVAPQYTTFGPQTYCDRKDYDCSKYKDSIKPCSELSHNKRASSVCTPSVVSVFINRITVNFPVFGAICFWAQFAFLGIYLITALTTLFRAPRLDTDELDEDLEEGEEEGLLGTTGRRLNAAWQDVTGRARRNNPTPNNYGTAG